MNAFRKLVSVPTSRLFQIASIGGVVVCSAGLLLRWMTIQKFRQSEYYRVSAANFMAHKPLVEFMGEPIHFGTVDLSKKSDNYSTTAVAHFQIPVNGTKHKGAMHFEAVRDPTDPKSRWRLEKLEVSIEQRPLDRVRVPITFPTYEAAVQYVENEAAQRQ